MMHFDCTDDEGHHFNEKVNNFINSTFQWTRTLSGDKMLLLESWNVLFMILVTILYSKNSVEGRTMDKKYEM